MAGSAAWASRAACLAGIPAAVLSSPLLPVPCNCNRTPAGCQGSPAAHPLGRAACWQGEIERTEELLPGFEDLEKERKRGGGGGSKRKAEAGDDGVPATTAAVGPGLGPACMLLPVLVVRFTAPVCCRSGKGAA